MKTKFLVVAMTLFVGSLSVCAQGNFPRKTVEERVKSAMDKIAAFNLDPEKTKQTDSVFTVFYKAVDAKRQEMRANGGMDRDKMREEMQKLAGERDEKFKKLFTDDQYKKWKDEIEPSLRPQRQGNGGGRR